MSSQDTVAAEHALPVSNGEPNSKAVKQAKSSSEQRLLFRKSNRTAQLLGVQIQGIGTYLPDLLVTNQQLESQHGFEEGWIERRTGIQKRHYAADDEGTSDLAAQAGRRAIKAAGLTTDDIDMVVVGTFTPDYLCPSTACLVQQKLNLDAAAMDVQAACSGFMYAMVTGAQFVATDNCKHVLVIGADINSRIVEPTDQGTAPLFGDAAGAVVLGKGSRQQGLVKYQLGADGAGGTMLDRPAGGTARPLTAEAITAGDHYLKMDGRNVFKWAIQAVVESISQVLESAGQKPDDVKLFVLHQANIRIIDHAMKVLGIPPEKVFNNLQQVGNTSAASIPLALEQAAKEKDLQPDDLVLMCGFGAGLTWGTGLFRW
ncbi:MAG: beta-ketoacyl-ACP synthase III [Fuerstiella sp.]